MGLGLLDPIRFLRQLLLNDGVVEEEDVWSKARDPDGDGGGDEGEEPAEPATVEGEEEFEEEEVEETSELEDESERVEISK